MEFINFKRMLKEVLDKHFPSNWEFVKYRKDLLSDVPTEDNYRRYLRSERAGKEFYPCNFQVEPLEATDETFGIVIYFPEVWVSNSKGLKVKIEESYILIIIIKRTFINMYGFKVSVSPREYETKRMHPHISYGVHSEGKSLGHCCTGGVGVGAFFETSTAVTEVSLNAFLFSLKDFISWEALDGGPYNYMYALYLERITEKPKISDYITPETLKILPSRTTVVPHPVYKYLKVQITFDDVLIRTLQSPSTGFYDGSRYKVSTPKLPEISYSLDIQVGQLHIKHRILQHNEVIFPKQTAPVQLTVSQKREFNKQLQLLTNKSLAWIKFQKQL